MEDLAFGRKQKQVVEVIALLRALSLSGLDSFSPFILKLGSDFLGQDCMA